jgi:hypothetical protein
MESWFIIHCAATLPQKMKMAYESIDEKYAASYCEALSLLRFLENEYLTDEDYVTGKKEFQHDFYDRDQHYYYDRYDLVDCECKSQIQEYDYLLSEKE